LTGWTVNTADVLARGEELRQQGVADGGGLWANAEYVDWLVEHGEALMRVARSSAELLSTADNLGLIHLCRDASQHCKAARILRDEGRRVGSISTLGAGVRYALASLGKSKPTSRVP
jgi:hypothetical protein